ncbi:MAG: sigma-54-dependent Fis family transcriptional regulator, partial [Deltaproteobacteria bacterium]
ELPMSVQKRFLRVLQEHHFRPVGGKAEIYSNFRLIAATNRNLESMVEKNHFRKDLIYRLKSLHLALPPLTKRKEDIRELLTHYLAKLCENNNIAIKGYSPEFFEALISYDWPGNVREFINTLESVVAESLDSPILVPYHLPVNIRICATQASIGDTQKPGKYIPSYEDISSPLLPTLKGYRENGLAALEKEYLEKLLATSKGNVRQACQISGLSRSRLYGLLKKYEILRK